MIGIARRLACLFVAVVPLACRSADRLGRASLNAAAVATLGAPDGYVFVFSPLNCSLQGEQIDVLNAIAARSQRSGIVLTSTPIDDSIAAAAVASLGIKMRTAPLGRTVLAGEIDQGQWRLPLAIAVRHGRVVGVLAGSDAERLDTWIEWLEGQDPQGNTRHD